MEHLVHRAFESDHSAELGRAREENALPPSLEAEARRTPGFAALLTAVLTHAPRPEELGNGAVTHSDLKHAAVAHVFERAFYLMPVAGPPVLGQVAIRAVVPAVDS